MAKKETDIKSFVIQAAKDEGRGVDVKEGLSSFYFYENILSNHLTAIATSLTLVMPLKRMGRE